MLPLINSFFVFNNIKVHPFILQDTPLPGFEVVDWNSWTLGNLYKLDLVDDVGFTPKGSIKVFGQVWKANDMSRLELLGSCFGAGVGVSRPILIELNTDMNRGIKKPAMTFALNEIKPTYEKLLEGRWRI